MIPLNKPLICRSSNKRDLNVIFKDLFPNYKQQVVFSARHGLDLIYKDIYRKKGICRVAVSPLTCFEALYPIVNNRHEIVFVDVDPNTFNMDEELIPENVDVIQAIHFGGNPQRVDFLKEMTKSNSQILVEDCAQALGSSFKGLQLGLFGDYSAFSFEKNIFALAGGLLISLKDMGYNRYSDASLKISIYRYIKRYLESKSSFDTTFTHKLLMTLLSIKSKSENNNNLSNIEVNKSILQSISSQMGCMDFLISKRKENARTLLNLIENDLFITQQIIPGAQTNYNRLFFKLKKGKSVNLVESLRNKGISANHLTQNWMKSYQKQVYFIEAFWRSSDRQNLKNYNEIHDKIVCIPVSPGLTEIEIKYIANSINKL